MEEMKCVRNEDLSSEVEVLQGKVRELKKALQTSEGTRKMYEDWYHEEKAKRAEMCDDMKVLKNVIEKITKTW